MKKKGFTLIELLVVIAIIAILAAILFPVFAKARSKARQSVCLSNLKQIGSALTMYVQDYDETIPQAWDTGVYDPYTNLWSQKMNPYIKNWNVFICPEERSQYTPAQLSQYMNGNGWTWNSAYSGYIINYTYFALTSGGTTSLSQIVRPADYFFLLEGPYLCVDPNKVMQPWQMYGLAGSGTDSRVDLSQATPAFAADFKTNRHTEGQNVLYADSHAKYTQIGKLVQSAVDYKNGDKNAIEMWKGFQ